MNSGKAQCSVIFRLNSKTVITKRLLTVNGLKLGFFKLICFVRERARILGFFNYNFQLSSNESVYKIRIFKLVSEEVPLEQHN